MGVKLGPSYKEYRLKVFADIVPRMIFWSHGEETTEGRKITA